MSLLLIFLFHSLTSATVGITEPTDSIPVSFHRLSSYPQAYLFAETPTFDQSGGHIQGIQLQHTGQDTFAFLSGSSSEIAYMAKVQLNAGLAKTLAIDTLLQAPFRHAGGFQLMGQNLAVGIEDNHLRTRSQVLVYDVSLEQPWRQPIYTVQRSGPYERSTAGAVGITSHQGQIILAVADWNARNLDIYSLPENDFQERTGTFEPITSLEIDGLDRTEWQDAEWHPYQNIHLISDQKHLYLVGLARTSSDQHIADLFTLHISDVGETATTAVNLQSSNRVNSSKTWPSYKKKTAILKKIGARVFYPSSNADFKAAGGIHVENARIQVLAAPYTLSENQGINIFGNLSKNIPTPATLVWTQTEVFPAKEAHQAAAADSLYFFAINNTRIGQYERKSGKLQKQVDVPGAVHLNSGFFHNSYLYMAHSNYPQKPDRSDIRRFDPRSGDLCTVVDFGETDGSLTWLVNHDGHWWGMFALYKENNGASYLVKWDAEWQEISRFTFPKEVVQKLGTMSVSGGVAYREGFLITGHDEREVYYVKIPHVGTVLEYVGTIPAPFTGQGIAKDPLTGGLVGIDRKAKKVVFATAGGD
ncbi:hypothetical protein [Lunatimonas salinarum]|uniref:hypothetical protein n=1 Tax=Lunatimonas salinarum TaxID=1774590 RepID=UPI001ADF1542|nr:hypothetical protein [Lunatimonas salinarum]